MSLPMVPDDILIIILCEMTDISDIKTIFYVNKEFYKILYDKMSEQKRRYENKQNFLASCGYPNDFWVRKAFTSVSCLFHCACLHEEYVKKYSDDFKSRAKYIKNNTNDINVYDAWSLYIESI